MVKVCDSLQCLHDGTTVVRWHLLDEDYRLIKPVERFLRFKLGQGVSTGTLKTYAEKLKSFWEYLSSKELDWRDFNRNHMKDFGYWYLTGNQLDKNAVSPQSDQLKTIRHQKTANLALTVVTQFYEFHAPTIGEKYLRRGNSIRTPRKGGILSGYLKQEPIQQKVVSYKESRQFPGCLQSEQIRTLIDACRTARDKLIIWLMADTGMRIGEVLGLHQKDIDWVNRRTIKIIRRENPNKALAKGEERTISIAKLMQNPEFCDIVTQYLDDEYPEDFVEYLGHGMVFVVLHQGSPSFGQPLSPQNINKLLERLHTKTGIDLERIYPHLFRHSFATHNIREARNKGKGKEDTAKIVQKQLGHRSIATTLDIYDHAFSEADLVQEIQSVVSKNGNSSTKN